MTTVLVFVMTMAVCVRTRFRLERRVDLRHSRAQAAQHLRKNVIGSDAQIPVSHLDGNVPVAEVIRRTRQRLRRVALDVQYALGLSDDLDDPSIRRDEQIAPAQHLAAREDERDRLAGDERRAQPTFLSQIESQFEPAARLHRTNRAMRVEAAADLDHQNRK
jgi:hypothetical protein